MQRQYINGPFTKEMMRDLLAGKKVKAETITLGLTYDTQQIIEPTCDIRDKKSHEIGTDYAEHYSKIEEERLMHLSEQQSGIPFTDRSSGIERLASDTFSIGTSFRTSRNSWINTSGTEVQLPENTSLEQVLTVYDRFKFDGNPFNKSLPIYSYKDEILDAIAFESVVVIQGDTGCGKTTQVPQYILEEAARNKKYCNIVVTQPRRIAAMSVAARVAKERNWLPGSICSYQVGLDRNTTADTRLLYCTTGVLLNQLITQKQMNNYTHVILDEVHERDQDMDFLLLIVRKFLWSISPNVKVILMSATLDSLEIAKYFSYPCMGVLQPARVIKILGHQYNVEEFYLEQIEANITIMQHLDFMTPILHNEIVNLAIFCILKLDKIECKPNTFGVNETRGSVLIFLPGLEQIDYMMSKLRQNADDHGFILLPLHSSITSQEQSQVFDTPPPSKRKIILSTNIAESSITVADVKYVFDFCLTKNLICNEETNYSSLQLQWASKANCIQRKGRAGRVGEGRVYRMVPFKIYQTFRDYQIPEILRSPIEQLILKTKILDLGEPKAILGLAIVPPNLRQIESTILMLKEVGALSSRTLKPHDGELTFLGRVLGQLPMDVRLGKLILLGHVFGFIEECIIISACHSVKSIFSQPFKFRLESYQRKMAWSDSSLSDSIAYLQAYRTWSGCVENGKFRTKYDEALWCKKMFLELNKLKEVKELVNELKTRLAKFRIFTSRDPQYDYPLNINNYNNMLLLKLILCGAFYPNYFTQSYFDKETAFKEISGYDPTTTVMVQGLPMYQGELYRKEMEQLFKVCAPGQPINITFRNTKAFIQFKGTQNHPNKILLAVYTAIKMREMRFNMSVKADLEYAMNTCSNAENNSTDKMGISSLPVLPAPNENTLSIKPVHVQECGHFWAKYYTRTTHERYLSLQSDITKYFNEKNPSPACNLKIGDFCLGLYSDGLFYRVKIIDIDYNKKLANIFYIDWGNYKEISNDDLFDIPEHLTLFRPLAFECCLIGICPSKHRDGGVYWSKEATLKFNQWLEMSDIIFADVYSIVDNVLRITLHGRINGKMINFNERLCEEEYAMICEESIRSKQSHEERLATCSPRTIVNSFLNEQTLSVDNLAKDLSSAVKIKEQQMINLMIKKDAPSMIKLRGPHSPFEVGFARPFSQPFFKTMKVDRESVNFVTISCDEKENELRPLMVAAFVGLNPKESVICARETTILPPIVGLPALITLLFTPIAELRTDKLKQEYTGALCGIGFDEQNLAMYPEHDLEVEFDFKFDVNDLKNINHLRIAINMALDGENGWSENSIQKYQEISRNKLLDLVNRPREKIPEQPYINSFKWNQIQESDLLLAKQEPLELFQLHNGIQLCDVEKPMTNFNKKEHQAYLERKAAFGWKIGEEIVCLLCDIVIKNGKDLKLHLQQYIHIKNLTSIPQHP